MSPFSRRYAGKKAAKQTNPKSAALGASYAETYEETMKKFIAVLITLFTVGVQAEMENFVQDFLNVVERSIIHK